MFNNDIGDSGCEALANELKKAKYLSLLDLSNNKLIMKNLIDTNGIAEKGGIALGEAIETNASITYLNLSKTNKYN